SLLSALWENAPSSTARLLILPFTVAVAAVIRRPPKLCPIRWTHFPLANNGSSTLARPSPTVPERIFISKYVKRLRICAMIVFGSLRKRLSSFLPDYRRPRPRHSLGAAAHFGWWRI